MDKAEQFIAVIRSYDGMINKVDLDVAALQSKYMENFNEDIHISDDISNYSQHVGNNVVEI